MSRIPSDAMDGESLVPVLIEFHDPPLVVYRTQHPLATAQQLQSYEQSLRETHRAFIARLDNQGITHSLSSDTALLSCAGGGCSELLVDHDFTYLFNGLGLLLPGKFLMDLAAMPGIKTVTGNHERAYLTLEHSVPFIGAPAVWELRDPKGNPVDGEGVTIAVIDTGIDWTHPAFGGYAEVPNPKVIYAVSYTGEPQIDNFGHGTHCAGIAAGEKYTATARGDSKIRGLAPKAQLMSYKVLTATGSGTAAAIVMAGACYIRCDRRDCR